AAPRCHSRVAVRPSESVSAAGPWSGPDPNRGPAMAKQRGRPAVAPCRFRRLFLEPLEDRALPSVSVVNNGGPGDAPPPVIQTQGYVPPDTNGAAGPTNYVETVNQTLAIYNPKATGASSTIANLGTFWFTTGGLPHADGGSGLSDPVVTYNDQIGRFIVGD